jgi:hypothetical protein
MDSFKTTKFSRVGKDLAGKQETRHSVRIRYDKKPIKTRVGFSVPHEIVPFCSSLIHTPKDLYFLVFMLSGYPQTCASRLIQEVVS